MSEVWNHFFMAPNGLSVTCNHCGKFMKRSDSSTKSMWGHLKAFHADLVGEETFRLKRTRRMRGEGGGGSGKGKAATTKAKNGEGKRAAGTKGGRKKTEAHNAATASNSSGASSSFSSASSSSGAEELDELEEPVECSSRASSQEVEGAANAVEEGANERKEEEEQKRKNRVPTPSSTVTTIICCKAEGNSSTAEVQKTPTQPYVKRKRPHQKERQSSECAEEVTLSGPLVVAAVAQQSGASSSAVEQHYQQQQQLDVPMVKPSSSSSSPTLLPNFGFTVPSASAAPIPCSASSAFSKYSTAALLVDNSASGGGIGGGGSVGTISPSHASEAPKQYARVTTGTHSQQHQSHPLPAPRPKYGLEALSGMDTTSLAMAGVADPAMLANLEAAATMNRLLNEYQHQQQKNSQNAMQQQQKLTTHNGTGHIPQSLSAAQQQQHISAQQLNELLTIYAASALQQQHKSGTADPVQQQQHQLAVQQATAAFSWLYNWEWMAAAATAQQTTGKKSHQKPVNGLSLLSSGDTTPSKAGNGMQQQQQQNVNERKTMGQGNGGGQTTTSCATSNSTSSTMNMLMSAGIPLLSALTLGGKMTGGAIGGGGNGTAVEVGHAGTNGVNNNGNSSSSSTNVPNGGETTKQNNQQPMTNNRQHQQQMHKRKSPAEERDCAASLLALADTAAAVEQRGGPSPPKNRKTGEKQQQQREGNANGLADGATEALAESLVLYGMHRIAMELQLSYYVHGNKAGRAEYAFYCPSTDGNANANAQQLVTLTESADHLLHIREYANGAVVAEECWPKNAEPGTLLLSLRDKCQRRLCA